MKIVFEKIEKKDEFIVNRYLKRKKAVWIVEPFYAFHHSKGIRFFPSPLPAFTNSLIKNKEINLLTADQLKAKTIYQFSADTAVDVIDSVFPYYRREHKELFQYVSDTLNSPVAEDIFKKDLCNRLAEFYSVNVLFYRIDKSLGPDTILVYTDTNVTEYLYLKNMLSQNNQKCFDHPSIRFPIQSQVENFFDDLKDNLVAIARLFLQTVASALLSKLPASGEIKSYSYGITIVSPQRQLADNRRGPDFIVDNNKILPKEVIYFPLTDLTADQKKRLAEMSCEVFPLPRPGRYFSNFTEWKNLLCLVFKKNFFKNAPEINGACKAFINYFIWQEVLKNINMRHFITHCDFGAGHIGRNLALKQAGIQTWYFNDSANSGGNWNLKGENNGVRHPFWTYMFYDHLVTWAEYLAKYYERHPGSFKQTHVVGCLWSGHLQDGPPVSKGIASQFPIDWQERFILAVFDSTYTQNGITSYLEGLTFAEHILQLAEVCPDIHIFLKEKKDRTIHSLLDPAIGPKLLDCYKKMDDHPRINTCSDQTDASQLISIAGMVVSFPFSSTTFEALSVNKPAIWHDPVSFYNNTPYGKLKGVTTHSYDELKAKVLEIKNMGPEMYTPPIPQGSPLMDPYRDGKAIERFRDLIINEL